MRRFAAGFSGGFVQGTWVDRHGCPRDHGLEGWQRAIETKGCDAIAIEPPAATFGLDGMEASTSDIDQPWHDRSPEDGMDDLRRWADEQLAGDDESNVFDDLF